MISFLDFCLSLPPPFQVGLGAFVIAIVIAIYKLLPFT